MRKTTRAQWAAHYAKRAAGYGQDAAICREQGDHREADRLAKRADHYLQRAAACGQDEVEGDCGSSGDMPDREAPLRTVIIQPGVVAAI